MSDGPALSIPLIEVMNIEATNERIDMAVVILKRILVFKEKRGLV
jgi:hypothetical protein